MLGGPHRRADRAPARAAVRGPDEGGPRHARPCARSSRNVVAEGASPSASRRPKREDKAQTGVLLEKVVAEMKSRISARAHKETQRRKNALE